MKRVTIVGVGALGSHTALFLRNAAKLRVVDHDRVEQKNVLSQFHGKPSVGRSKVQSLQQTMNFLFGLQIEAVPHKLTRDNDSQLLSGSDLVIDCLDNGEARRIVQDYVRSHNIPCLHGALAADGTFGRVIWDADFRIDDESAAGAATCEDGEHLPFIGMVGTFLAHSAKIFLESGSRRSFSVYSRDGAAVV